VGAIDDILTIINAQIRPHVIIAGDQVVGFFLIDTIYVQTNDVATLQSLGLRKFFNRQTTPRERLRQADTSAIARLPNGHLPKLHRCFFNREL